MRIGREGEQAGWFRKATIDEAKTIASSRANAVALQGRILRVLFVAVTCFGLIRLCVN